MAWEDNRNKSIREISKEERLQWLQEQIETMEGPKPVPPTITQRIAPRIRRNGKWV